MGEPDGICPKFNARFHVPLSPSLRERYSSQLFSAERANAVLVFQSDYRYLMVALGIIAIALGMVLCLLCGYRELNRYVTLSPFEIARAFGALVAELASENLGIDEIIRKI